MTAAIGHRKNGRVLVKTRLKAYLEELDNRVDDMPEVYRAINAIQNTPWKINVPVLEAAKALWDRPTEAIAGCPRVSLFHCPRAQFAALRWA